jgi:hypothetical protein
MNKRNAWLFAGVAAAAALLGSQSGFSQNRAQSDSTIKGLPASDVLGSEDIWDNPTFVGGVIDGGPTASSEY